MRAIGRKDDEMTKEELYQHGDSLPAKRLWLKRQRVSASASLEALGGNAQPEGRLIWRSCFWHGVKPRFRNRHVVLYACMCMKCGAVLQYILVLQ